MTISTKNRKRGALTGKKIGLVSNDKRDKTRIVTVGYLVRHPKYGKYLKRATKYHVHDEHNVSRTGDRVEIVNCRPLSKSKSWRLVRVVQSAREAASKLPHMASAQLVDSSER